MLTLTNEMFSLRGNELVTVQEEQPVTVGRFLAIMARSVEMPPGERSKVRATDGAPVEQAAILAAEIGENGWQWTHLSSATKEVLGDLLFDCGASLDRWYFAVIENNFASNAHAVAGP